MSAQAQRIMLGWTFDELPDVLDRQPKPVAPKMRRRSERERFLRSPEWRAARELCFATHGLICYRCRCSATQVDHILPRSKFKHLALEQSNLRPICWPCNRAKAAHVLELPS